MKRLAILDDYMRLARSVADWTQVEAQCAVDVFDRALVGVDAAATELEPYEILCTMRERMAFPRALFERLPNLKLLVVTGEHHRLLDVQAATDHGVIVSNTGLGSGYRSASELTWALILAAARHIPQEDRGMRSGGWQTRLGMALYEKTLGLVGLGNIGGTVAGYGRAFGMQVMAWSPNLTAERAAEVGARAVAKDELFRRSDILSLHVRLGERSRGVVGAAELALMKSTAILINTSRGPLVDEPALIETLRAKRIAAAGLDVYDQEPLTPDQPLRSKENTVLTPHVGYLTEDLFQVFYQDSVEDVLAYLAGSPIRILNPDVLTQPRGKTHLGSRR